MVGLIVLPILLIVLFFFSIFLGSSYLQSHILVIKALMKNIFVTYIYCRNIRSQEDQNGSSNVVNRIGIGLPNTRSVSTFL